MRSLESTEPAESVASGGAGSGPPETRTGSVLPPSGRVSHVPCVLLCRVSSKEQEETGYSLPAQERLLTEYALRKGLTPERTFHIAESAAAPAQRRVFGQMLAYMRQSGVKHLICEKVDRLTRNYKDAVVVDDWLEEDPERQAHLVKDSLVLHKHSRSQEKLNWGIRVVMAKNYADNLSEEVRKGRDEKFAQGVYPGTSPFGYRFADKDGGSNVGKRRMHVVDPDQAQWVKLMFDLVDKHGYSIRKIEAYLREQNVTVRSGRPISRTNIHRYLTDPFYCGEIAWDGRRGRGAHEPLVSRAQWERVQVRLRRGDTPMRYNVKLHLLQGLVRCAGCNGVISWEEHKGHVYGHCNGYRSTCPERSKGSGWARQDRAEAALRLYLGALKVKDPLISAYIGSALENDEKAGVDRTVAAREQAEQALARVRQRLAVLYEDRLDGRVTAAFHDQKAAELRSEEARLEETLDGPWGGTDLNLAPPSYVYSLGQRASELYAAGDRDEKREVLGRVFSGLTLDGAGALRAEYRNSYRALQMAVQQTNGSKIRVERLPAVPTFELLESGSGTHKSGLYTRSCLAWRDTWDEFRTLVTGVNARGEKMTCMM